MTQNRHIPMRSCIACRRQRPKHELIRFVADADGRVECDPDSRKPGRGAYTCPDEKCFGQAIDQHQFSRAFRRQINIHDEQLFREEFLACLNKKSSL